MGENWVGPSVVDVKHWASTLSFATEFIISVYFNNAELQCDRSSQGAVDSLLDKYLDFWMLSIRKCPKEKNVDF